MGEAWKSRLTAVDNPDAEVGEGEGRTQAAFLHLLPPCDARVFFGGLHRRGGREKKKKSRDGEGRQGRRGRGDEGASEKDSCTASMQEPAQRKIPCSSSEHAGARAEGIERKGRSAAVSRA